MPSSSRVEAHYFVWQTYGTASWLSQKVTYMGVIPSTKIHACTDSHNRPENRFITFSSRFQVNPEQSSYFNESISRGCAPNNAHPFSYRPHYAQHVDPETGNVSKIIVVPAAMVNCTSLVPRPSSLCPQKKIRERKAWYNLSRD